MSVPVHCKCGWSGARLAAKIKARPCPNCDGEVARWRKLETQAAIREEITRPLEPTPIEAVIAETYAPVPRLPCPYRLYTYTGEVQVFRIPPHVARRGRAMRRKRRA